MAFLGTGHDPRLALEIAGEGAKLQKQFQSFRDTFDSQDRSVTCEVEVRVHEEREEFVHAKVCVVA